MVPEEEYKGYKVYDISLGKTQPINTVINEQYYTKENLKEEDLQNCITSDDYRKKYLLRGEVPSYIRSSAECNLEIKEKYFKEYDYAENKDKYYKYKEFRLD
jgi:hypothetical protein